MMPSATQRFSRPLYVSVLPGVSDIAWDAYVRASSARKIQDVSRWGGIGSFDLRPRRLGEIGVMVNMRREGEHGLWVGDLVPAYANLHRSVGLQREVFEKSTALYDVDLSGMARPEGASRSGCLSVLHCGGIGALEEWPEGAFKTTKELFERTNGIF